MKLINFYNEPKYFYCITIFELHKSNKSINKSNQIKQEEESKPYPSRQHHARRNAFQAFLICILYKIFPINLQAFLMHFTNFSVDLLKIPKCL